MTVIQMSQRELSRLRVLIDLSDKRLTMEASGIVTLTSSGDVGPGGRLHC
jgi:hypothetical protein